MNKRRLIIFLVSLVVLFSLPVSVLGDQQISVKLNNGSFEFDVPPVMEEGRVLVPLRAIFEGLGAEVKWDDSTGSITATKDTDTINLMIGNSTAVINYSTVALDVPAKLIKGRTMVPLRFVSEALGAQVGWDSTNQTVSIYKKIETKMDEIIVETKSFLSIEYENNEGSSTLRIPGLLLNDAFGVPIYQTKRLGETKYLIKFDSSLGDIKAEQIDTNDSLVKKISVSSDKLTKKTKIVIESNVRLDFEETMTIIDPDFALKISANPLFESTANPPLEEEDLSVKIPLNAQSTIGDEAVELAKTFLGVRYLWGGTSPNGFDCSGLMVYVYKQFGITLPRIADDQSRSGITVEKSDLKAGDLVFFYTDRSRPNIVGHAGMYIGNGNFIHSSTNGVTISSMYNSWYNNIYQGAKRYWSY